MTAPAPRRAAPGAAVPARAALSTTVDVETPELVVLSYTVAGPGSRAAAAAIDYLISIGAMLLVVLAIAQFRRGEPRTARGEDSMTGVGVAVILSLLQWATLWLYYVLWEALADGQTPGKRAMRLRVVRDGGLAITFGASAIRNIVRVIDMQPAFVYLAGFVSMIANKQGKRLGDLAAGTLVVREDAVRQPITVPGDRKGAAASGTGTAALSEEEWVVLDRFAQRYGEIAAERRAPLAEALAARFAAPLASISGPSLSARLIALHDREQIARASGAASRSDRGAARERYAIVAANAARWNALSQRVSRAQELGGLGKLPEKEVREFVQEYREVSADLARLRTATRGRAADEVFYLNRLVASAHSLLYRRRSLALRATMEYLFGAVPREIRASWRPILLAALLLFLPMTLAGTAVYTDPAVAESLVPAGMIDRAEQGVERAKKGTGYIEDPQLYRPLMASSIITNNVQVAFFAFAAGITAGVLTLWILLSNGLSIGAVFGLYASKGIGTLLLAFVAPHGVLELTAIAVAGGAGFLIAAGMLLPGERTRRSALVHNAQRAIRLVAGAAVLLLVAGTLEGMVSPIPDWPLSWKLAVSAATAVLLVAYLAGGSRRFRTPAGDQSAPRALSSR